ncbi:DUF1697 domain-containing protein [Candidatus Saccharibacteria bacterium]|nr:MAG: DUF1697 domain-containing protein [Candidatus Saccharibacteria bacterium]
MTYVVLLRGVNVGGNTRVEMSRLKAILESLGCTDVQTYLNSGNAVCKKATKLNATEVEKAIEVEFGFAVPVLVLDANTVCRVAESIPESWRNDDDQKSDVAFLFPAADDASIVMKVGCNSDIETGLYVPGALLWNIERKHQSRGSLPKVVGTPLYQQMSIRNVNTARKLAELVQS